MVNVDYYRKYTSMLDAATSLLEHKLRECNVQTTTEEVLEIAQLLLDRLKELRIYVASMYGNGPDAASIAYNKPRLMVEKIIAQTGNIDNEINAFISGVNTLKL
ncbi:hypothetical protein BZQ24_08320 [Salmonella enterica subsp. enterica serovar Enteritidis]|nr:hypothetical protein [Salmonella enterica subsp. enterica serovar Enteritidis]